MFTFKCNYKTETSTNGKTYEVLVRTIGNEVEHFLSWDNAMSLNIYSDETFSTRLSPHSLIVGSRFHIEIKWNEQFTEAMPVRFYIDECTVSSVDGLKSFNVIQEGCTSDLVQVERHLNLPADYHSLFAVDNLRFSYKSFSFVRTTGTFKLELTCNLRFCLKAELADTNGVGGTCGFDDKNCPSGYSSSGLS